MPATAGPALATRLLPSAPNPFADATAIGFELERARPVEVTVYDLAGHRVRRVAAGLYGAGPHSESWDGRSDAGRLMPSGVYAVRLRLEAGQATHAGKLILMR